MVELVRRFKLPDGKQIWIETTELGVGEAGKKGETVDVGLADRAKELVGDATQTFEEAWEGVQEAIKVIVDAVRQVAPDEVEVKLGLKLSGEVGVIVAKGSGEANLEVKAIWKS